MGRAISDPKVIKRFLSDEDSSPEVLEAVARFTAGGEDGTVDGTDEKVQTDGCPSCACCSCDAIKAILNRADVNIKANGKKKRKPSAYNLHIKDCIARRKAEEIDEDHQERFKACVVEWKDKKKG
jgi:hypothetical protein